MNYDWTGRLIHALPGLLLRPLGYVPRRISNQGIIALCHQVFADPLAAGELSFLNQRVLKITAEDAGVDLVVRGNGARLCIATESAAPDVSISGTAYDLLLLLSRREDADTLFFQRRLRLEGDTELGLHLKNFLDAWEPPVTVQWFQQLTNRCLAWAERTATSRGMATRKPSPQPRRIG